MAQRLTKSILILILGASCGLAAGTLLGGVAGFVVSLAWGWPGNIGEAEVAISLGILPGLCSGLLIGLLVGLACLPANEPRLNWRQGVLGLCVGAYSGYRLAAAPFIGRTMPSWYPVLAYAVAGLLCTLVVMEALRRITTGEPKGQEWPT